MILIFLFITFNIIRFLIIINIIRQCSYRYDYLVKSLSSSILFITKIVIFVIVAIITYLPIILSLLFTFSLWSLLLFYCYHYQLYHQQHQCYFHHRTTFLTCTITITSLLPSSPPSVPFLRPSETVPLKRKKVSREVAQTCGSLLGSFATACSSLRSLSSARDCAGCRGVFAQASRGARDPSGDQSPPSDLRLISSRPSQAEGLRPGGGTGLQAGEGDEEGWRIKEVMRGWRRGGREGKEGEGEREGETTDREEEGQRKEA